MKLSISIVTLLMVSMLATAAPEVTFESLLREMADRDAVARFHVRFSQSTQGKGHACPGLLLLFEALFFRLKSIPVPVKCPLYIQMS